MILILELRGINWIILFYKFSRALKQSHSNFKDSLNLKICPVKSQKSRPSSCEVDNLTACDSVNFAKIDNLVLKQNVIIVCHQSIQMLTYFLASSLQTSLALTLWSKVNSPYKNTPRPTRAAGNSQPVQKPAKKDTMNIKM